MMKQLFKHAQRASIVLMAIFVLSCGDDDEEDQLPQVTSSFTQVVNNTTGVVTFTNTSTNATTYLWDLNDGTTSTAFEPVNTYTSGTYTVKLTASNSAGGTATSQNTFTVTVPGSVDATKPIITLVGEATINLTVGDPYTDQGATANDNLDGNITASIVKGGATVNTAVAGSYVITFNVKDAAGNDAIEVTRTVIVTAFDSGLLANGSFSIPNGQPGAAWFGIAFNVLNEGGTNFNFANVLSPLPPNAFEINLSQVVALVQGKNYILSFEASSDRSRTIIAGIGLNEGAFTSASEIVNLTTAKQTFTLNLSAAAFGGANSRVLFDMGGALGVVVLDNVKLVLGPDTPCTAETVQSLVTADFNLTFKTDPGAAIISENTTYIYSANPNFTNATNSSCFVGKIVKSGVNPWDNNQIIVDTKLDFTTKSGFKMKVYSPVAGAKVLLKLEDKTNQSVPAPAEVEKTLVQANVWEELTFDFGADKSNKYDKIVLFFDYGVNTSTYYFDDLKLYGTGPSPCTPETAENINPASGNINWTFKTNDMAHTFDDFGDITSTIVTNPLIAGINTSCNVQKYTKTGGCQTWSGVGIELQTAVNWVTATDKVFKMKVLAETQVTQVTLRMETLPFPNANPAYDRVASITQVGVWQELTFDFSDVTTGSSKSMIIYFDRDQPCDGDVYYFDDIIQVPGGSGPPPPGSNLAANGNFETGTDAGWLRFQNGGTALLDNTTPNNGAGSWSGKLTISSPGNPAFKQERIGSGTVQAGDVVRITFDHKGVTVPPGAVFNVLLFGEGGTPGATFTHVFNPAPVLSSGWTTFTGNFTIAGGTDVSQGISFLIEAVCGGDAGCSVTANIDNVSVVLNP